MPVDCTVEVRSKRHDGCERDPPHMLQTYHYSNPACPGRHYGTREKCQRIDRAYKPVVHILKVVSTASIKPELPVFQCSSSINEDCPLCEAERDSEIEEDFQSSPSHFPPIEEGIESKPPVDEPIESAQAQNDQTGKNGKKKSCASCCVVM